jgi:hypothetical protein
VILTDARGELGRFAGLVSREREVRGVPVAWFEAPAVHLAHRAALALAQGAPPGALFSSPSVTVGTCAGPFVLLRAQIDLPRARLAGVVFAKIPSEAPGLLGELVAIAVSTSRSKSARVRVHDEA